MMVEILTISSLRCVSRVQAVRVFINLLDTKTESILMQENIMNESIAMVPDAEQRLKLAIKDLNTFIVRVSF